MSNPSGSNNEAWREANPNGSDADSSDESGGEEILARVRARMVDSSDNGDDDEEENSDVEPDGNDEELDMYFDNVDVGDSADEEEEEVDELEADEVEVNEVDEEMDGGNGGGDNGGDMMEEDPNNGQEEGEKCFTCRTGGHNCVHPVSVAYPGKVSTKCVRCYEKRRPCSLDTNVRSQNVRRQRLEQARNQGERRALRGDITASLRRLRAEDRATADTLFALRTTQEHIMQRLEAAQDLAYLRLLYVYKLQQINDNGDRDQLAQWFEALDRYNLEGRIRDNDMNDHPTAADVAEMAFEIDDEE